MRAVGQGALRPLWGGGGLVRVDESFLLSCHLLYYQDWLLCFMTYLYARGAGADLGGTRGRGLHSFLWACHSLHSGLVLG